MDDKVVQETWLLEGYDFGHLMQRLAARCYERQTIMRCVLRSIEDDSILGRATTSTDEKSELALIRFEVSSPPPELISLQQAVIDDTFIGVVRAFFDFVDGLHGALRWAANPFVLDRPISGGAELETIIVEKLDAVIHSVAADHSLGNRKKISDLGLFDRDERMCDGLREVRRTLEHHKGIAQRDIELPLYYLDAVYIDGQRLLETGSLIEPGEHEFSATWLVETYSFAKGVRIALDETQVERTIGTILNVLMPEMRQAMFKASTAATAQRLAHPSD